MLKIIALVIACLLIAGFAYVRLAPLDAATLHVDPEGAPKPSNPGHAFLRASGDIEPSVYDLVRTELAQKLEAIILGTPRTIKLAGDLDTSFATYVTRSKLWGFPDIASVKIIDAGQGKSSALIFSRQRYGYADLGVNLKRVQDWLAKL